MKPEALDYHQTLIVTYALLETLNRADTCGAQPWQYTDDARKTFEHDKQIALNLGGRKMFELWCETNELDLTLADRNDEC
jgi:hypothetical protein